MQRCVWPVACVHLILHEVPTTRSAGFSPHANPPSLRHWPSQQPRHTCHFSRWRRGAEWTHASLLPGALGPSAQSQCQDNMAGSGVPSHRLPPAPEHPHLPGLWKPEISPHCSPDFSHPHCQTLQAPPSVSRCDMRLGESLTCLFPPGSEGLEAGILHAHCFLVAGDGLLGE